MTGRRTLSDETIAAMLRARAASPVPSSLGRNIAEAVATDAVGATGTGRRRSPTGRRSWPLLLVAATLLLAVGGGALVLSRPTEQRPPSTPAPSAGIVAPSPSLEAGTEPCVGPGSIITGPAFGVGTDIDEQAGIIGRSDTPITNGPIIAMAERDPADGPVPSIDLLAYRRRPE